MFYETEPRNYRLNAEERMGRNKVEPTKFLLILPNLLPVHPQREEPIHAGPFRFGSRERLSLPTFNCGTKQALSMLHHYCSSAQTQVVKKVATKIMLKIG